MSLTFKLAFRYLLSNKTRTILTSLGIILAVFFLTTVSVLVTSLNSSLVATTIKERGDWHFVINNMSDVEIKDTISAVSSEKCGGISRYSTAIPIENPIKTNKSYLHFVSVLGDYFSMQPIELLEGRLPTNLNEIVAPISLIEDYPTKYFLGKIINVSNTLYEIVGIASVSKRVEANFRDGYILFTSGLDDDFSNYNIYIKLSNLKADYDYMKKMIGETGGYGNSELFDVLGMKQGENIKSSINTVATITMLIIIISAVALISNAFIMSLSERTVEYGLLRSIGASGAKLASIVFTEAVLLSLISLPIGILLGIFTVYVTLNPVGTLISKAAYIDIVFHIDINEQTIFAIIGLSLFTILASSILPIIKCANNTLISSIRQNKDVKPVRGRSKSIKILSSGCLNIVFLLACKYFKNYKKKACAIISSFAFCIILLVTANGLTSYGKSYIASQNENYYYNIDCITIESMPDIKAYINKTFPYLSEIEGVNESAWYAELEGGYVGCDIIMSEDALKYIIDSDIQQIHYAYYCISDDTFISMMEQAKAYANGEEIPYLSAVALGDFLHYEEYKGESIKKKIPILDKSPININIQTSEDITKILTIFNIPTSEAPKNIPVKLQYDTINILFPLSNLQNFIDNQEGRVVMRFNALNHSKVTKMINEYNKDNNELLYVIDLWEDAETQEQLYVMINIIAVIMSVIILLISIINTFNMNLFSITLRKRELGIMRSLGMTDNSIRKMLIYENLLLSMISIVIGVLASSIISVFLLFCFNEPLLSYVLPFKAIGISSSIIILFSFLSSLLASKKANICEIKEMLML